MKKTYCHAVSQPLRSRRFRFRQNITFCTSATYAPYEFVDADNKIVGFDIDVANAVCKEMQAECSFTNQSFDSLIPAYASKV